MFGQNPVSLRRICKVFRMMSLGCLLPLLACQPKPDLEKYREEILALHKASIEAHINKDADFFTKDVAEDYVVVSRADVFHPTPKETKAQFSDYLNRTTFTQYRDLREPIIGFSDDGSMAYSIVQVQVAGTQTADANQSQPVRFTSAWINLFKRDGERWILLTNVSNVVRG